MKRKYNKDGSIDYIFSKKEFMAGYMVGCLTKMNDKQVTIRVSGSVPNLKKVVIRK